MNRRIRRMGIRNFLEERGARGDIREDGGFGGPGEERGGRLSKTWGG